ncbi:hypothetical protein HK101_006698 [Irineochytrium annulatum]|nr:hypothetical protein HK101_006698 [Irineochytrium annulatum]
MASLKQTLDRLSGGGAGAADHRPSLTRFLSLGRRIRPNIVFFTLLIFILLIELNTSVLNVFSSAQHAAGNSSAGTCLPYSIPVSKKNTVSHPVLKNDPLDVLLAGAADRNRTIMLVPFNQAYILMMANFVCSIERMQKRENVKLPLVYWPLDSIAFEWAKGRKLEPIFFDKSLFSVIDWVGYDENGKQSSYFRMMRERGKVFKRIVHDLGYNMFFLDSDIVIMENPLKMVTWDASLEIQIDAWKKDDVYIKSVAPAPGPAEVIRKEMTPAERRADALRGPVRVDPIPYFQPESQPPFSEAITGCAGAFFLKADRGGRYVASQLEQILRERGDLDDQQALNDIINNKAWIRNLARPYDEERVNDHPRYFIMRYFNQHRAINGHVFFTFREEYLKAKDEHKIPPPALIHGNGVEKKQESFKKLGLWFLTETGECLAE